MDTLLLSRQEAARLLGLSLRGLEHLIARKEIPTRRIGRRVLIARSALESFAREGNSDKCSEGETRANQLPSKDFDPPDTRDSMLTTDGRREMK